jgi:hypothetical protein
VSLNSETRRVDYLAGQIQSLIGFTLAAINTHPDPANMQAHLETVDLAATANAGGVAVSETFLEGMRNVSERLQGAVEMARLRKGVPRTEPY